jgi:hypothetical protein
MYRTRTLLVLNYVVAVGCHKFQFYALRCAIPKLSIGDLLHVCCRVNAMPSLVSGYYNLCLQCGAHFVELAFEGKPVSLSTVLLDTKIRLLVTFALRPQ